MDNLTETDRSNIRAAYLAIRLTNGRVMVDDAIADTDDVVVHWFGVASGTQIIGLMKTRSMIDMFRAYARQSQAGRVVQIDIRNQPVGVTARPVGGE